MPNGFTFALENQQGIMVNGSQILFKSNSGNDIIYDAVDNTSASNLFGAIVAVMTAPANYTSIAVGLTWASIVPSAVASGVSTAFMINGTGFSLFGVDENIVFDDGAGHTITQSTTVTSDSVLTSNANVTFPVAGSYTVYYGFGCGWTTTGLVVTVS
jgi:hypothetical protein